MRFALLLAAATLAGCAAEHRCTSGAADGFETEETLCFAAPILRVSFREGSAEQGCASDAQTSGTCEFTMDSAASAHILVLANAGDEVLSATVSIIGDQSADATIEPAGDATIAEGAEHLVEVDPAPLFQRAAIRVDSDAVNGSSDGGLVVNVRIGSSS